MKGDGRGPEMNGIIMSQVSAPLSRVVTKCDLCVQPEQWLYIRTIPVIVGDPVTWGYEI